MERFKALVYVFPGACVGLAETLLPAVDRTSGLGPAAVVAVGLGLVGGTLWYIASPMAIAEHLKAGSLYWLLLVAVVALSSIADAITPSTLHVAWGIGQDLGLIALGGVTAGVLVAERYLTRVVSED